MSGNLAIVEPIRPKSLLMQCPDLDPGSTVTPEKATWLRRASFASVVLGIAFYICGIVVPLNFGEYAAAFHVHLIIRGVAAAVAALILVAGIMINKPRHLSPWLFLLLLIFSYTLRPILSATGYIDSLNGWLIFSIVLLQRCADAAAIIAIVWLRKIGRITSTSIENAIIILAYLLLSVHFVAIPGWTAYDSLSLTLTFGVVTPVCYGIVVVLVGRLLFVDILQGRAFQLMMAAWVINIAFDIVGHNIFETSQTLFWALVFDVLGLSAFLWAAASLHPSMHEVSRPAISARSDWSFLRSISLVAAAAIPLAMSQFHHSAQEHLAIFVVGLLILVLLLMRTRAAVLSLVASKTKLIQSTQTDPLTGLNNRRHLYAVLENCVQQQREFAVMLVDIDGFKQVNDAHGHLVGDDVLRQVATRISHACPNAISTARIGGDEFSILFPKTPKDELIERGNQIVQACRFPVLVENLVINIGASVSINIVEKSELNGDAIQHIERADYALFHAKVSGRGRVALFTPEFESAIKRAALVEQTLKGADIDNEVSVVFQPVVHAHHFAFAGFEALARWHSPVLGNVAPDEFIQSAERCGVVHNITRKVLHASLQQMKLWPTNFRLKVNLSTRDLLSAHQVQAIIAMLRSENVDARRLTFEITETAFSDNFEAIESSIHLLHATGASIAIDDFGTGYSSLGAVHHIHPDVIKIDKSFVDRINDGHNGHAMVKTIIEMCNNLGTRSLAEGVEDQNQVQLLTELGCDYLQGYYFSKPVSAQQAIKLALDGVIVPSHLQLAEQGSRSQNSPKRKSA